MKQGQTRSPVSWLWRVLLLRRPSKAAAKYWQIGGGPACFQLCLGKTRPDPNTDPDPLIRRAGLQHDEEKCLPNDDPLTVDKYLTQMYELHKVCRDHHKIVGFGWKSELGTYHVHPATVLTHRKKLSFLWHITRRFSLVQSRFEARTYSFTSCRWDSPPRELYILTLSKL